MESGRFFVGAIVLCLVGSTLSGGIEETLEELKSLLENLETAEDQANERAAIKQLDIFMKNGLTDLLEYCPDVKNIVADVRAELKRIQKLTVAEVRQMKKIKASTNQLPKVMKSLQDKLMGDPLYAKLFGNTTALSMVESTLAMIVNSNTKPIGDRNTAMTDEIKLIKKACDELKPALRSKDKDIRKLAKILKKVLKKILKSCKNISTVLKGLTGAMGRLKDELRQLIEAFDGCINDSNEMDTTTEPMAVTTTSEESKQKDPCDLMTPEGGTVLIQWQYKSYEPKCVYKGTVIRFEWEGDHNVMGLKNKKEFDNCEIGGNVEPDETKMAEYTLDQCKTFYFACGVGVHCMIGEQKVEIQVIERQEEMNPDDETTTPIVTMTTSVPPMMKPENDSCNEVLDGKTIDWNWNAGNEEYESICVKEGSTVTFVWGDGNHNVEQLDHDEYMNCGVTMSDKDDAGTKSITFEKEGTYYFVCGVGKHCSVGGMKISIIVVEEEEEEEEEEEDKTTTDDDKTTTEAMETSTKEEEEEEDNDDNDDDKTTTTTITTTDDDKTTTEAMETSTKEEEVEENDANDDETTTTTTITTTTTTDDDKTTTEAMETSTKEEEGEEEDNDDNDDEDCQFCKDEMVKEGPIISIPWLVKKYAPMCVRKGSTVTFSFPNNHNVNEMTKEDFETCSNFVDKARRRGPVMKELNEAKAYYFACGVGMHCWPHGQKIKICAM